MIDPSERAGENGYASLRMIPRLRHWWQQTRASFWFVPAMIVLGAVGLASALIALDVNIEARFDKKWPLFFGAGADGSRGLLTAVAGSMITVAGTVFSITIVALSLTSSQYTSRVLRNFMRDRTNQAVLGVFVGIFAYCLVVLRTIRGGDEGAFVPSLAVLGGLGLAFVGTGYLIYFIHHISISIQASSIIAAAAEETMAAIDHLFPKDLGQSASEDSSSDNDRDNAADDQDWLTVAAPKTGYVESVDGDSLLALAQKADSIVRMECGIGDFVVEGAPLMSVGRRNAINDQTVSDLISVYVISRQRTVEQDAGFGIRQIVDIALKALSPGINDTTTAVMCVDYLGAILGRLAAREIKSHRRLHEGELRVIARGPSFESLLAEAFDQIRQNAAGNVAVLARQLRSLDAIASRTASTGRRQALRRHAAMIIELAKRTIASNHDLAPVQAASATLLQTLDGDLPVA
ncbi:MAG: DUF2254 domain-containing protein [Planctomycetaceae bacterium]